MLYIVLILLVTLVSLTVVLWITTFFFQGYIYTAPSGQLYWQAPAAAALLTLGYAVWCFSIALSSGANQQNLPFDTLFRFSPREDMLTLPAKTIWAVKLKKPGNEEEKKAYERKRDERNEKKFYYVDLTLKHGPWQSRDVIAIEIEKPDGGTMRFDAVQGELGKYREFVSSDGWVMHEFENGPTGAPMKFSIGRLLVNIFFNVAHLAGWFLALWVILRFQWAHALGFAVVAWAAATLTVLPMMLTYSGYIAATGRTPTG